MRSATPANDLDKHWKLGRPSHVVCGTAVDRSKGRSWDQHGAWITGHGASKGHASWIESRGPKEMYNSFDPVGCIRWKAGWV